MRITEKKDAEMRKRNRGLGGLLRGRIQAKSGGRSAADTTGAPEERVISLASIVGGFDESGAGAPPPPPPSSKLELKGYGGITLAPGMDHAALQVRPIYRPIYSLPN